MRRVVRAACKRGFHQTLMIRRSISCFGNASTIKRVSCYYITCSVVFACSATRDVLRSRIQHHRAVFSYSIICTYFKYSELRGHHQSYIPVHIDQLLNLRQLMYIFRFHSLRAIRKGNNSFLILINRNRGRTWCEYLLDIEEQHPLLYSLVLAAL